MEEWNKAKIICIEGIDGVGKHTQSEMLFYYLRENGYNVLLRSYPNYDNISSSLVKGYLDNTFKVDNNPYAIAAFYACDRYISLMNDKDLRHALEFYDYVIFDRYTPSNILYQSSRANTGTGARYIADYILNFEHKRLNLPVPDSIIYLYAPIDILEKSIKARSKEENRPIDKHEKDIKLLKTINSNKNIINEVYSKNYDLDCDYIDCNDGEELFNKDVIHNMIIGRLKDNNII